MCHQIVTDVQMIESPPGIEITPVPECLPVSGKKILDCFRPGLGPSNVEIENSFHDCIRSFPSGLLRDLHSGPVPAKDLEL
jgi:hypothetical protein